VLESVTRQVPPLASLAVQFPVTDVRVGAPVEAGTAGSGREATCVWADGCGVRGAGSARGGSGSIGMVEPIGGRPGVEPPGLCWPGKPPDAMLPPGGGNGLESTRSVGAGVKVCALGGGGSGNTVWRAPPKLENLPEPSQPTKAKVISEATISLSEYRLIMDYSSASARRFDPKSACYPGLLSR
jgi:hypothetical protein